MMEKSKQIILWQMGERISKARAKANMTQEQLAEELNISRISVARYESGEMAPKLQNVVAIALALDVSVDYLLGLDDRNGLKIEPFSFEAEAALETFVKEIIKQYEKVRK